MSDLIGFQGREFLRPMPNGGETEVATMRYSGLGEGISGLWEGGDLSAGGFCSLSSVSEASESVVAGGVVVILRTSRLSETGSLR